MKYYFTYKTTNLINGKVYYGKHETKELNDGYLGSGLYLSRAIKKYGRENFSREILSFYHNRENMIAAEKELVTEEVILSKQTYNIALGGQGGNLGVIVNAKISQVTKGISKPYSESHKKAMRLAKTGYIPTKKAIEKTRNTINQLYSTMSEQEKKEKFGRSGKENGFYNKRHSNKFIEKQRQTAKNRGSIGNPNAKPVTINGITYPLMKIAMKDLGLTRTKLLKLIGEKYVS